MKLNLKNLTTFSVTVLFTLNTAFAELSNPLLLAENVDSAATPSNDSHDKEKKEWQYRLDTEKGTRGLLLGMGIAGIAGGLFTYGRGFSENQSAGDVNGCSRDGFSSVVCDNEENKNDAQNKIDSGLNKMMLGVGISALGAGFLVFGILRNRKISALKREGQQKGFVWDLQIQDTDKTTLALNYIF